jgi:hypothetical protein
MKKHLVLLLLLIASYNVFSQNKVLVKLSCGWAGETSSEISKFRSYIADSNFSMVKTLLQSENQFERLLSAVTLNDLKDSGKIVLNPQEEKLLNRITLSKAKYEICYTCTFNETVTFNQLFSRYKNVSYLLIRNRLFAEQSSTSTSE